MAINKLARFGYGAAALALMGVVGLPCWLLVLTLPKLSWRWQVTRAALRVLTAALGVTVTVQGVLPPPGKPCVVVANHASVLDSFVLFLVFREPVVFVAGGVFAGQRIAGPFLRRVGAQFVRTGTTGRQAVRSVLRQLAEIVRSGQRLVFFPEGGLNPGPALRRFQLGAFVVASQASSPVVPVAITGTGHMLGPHEHLPRHGNVTVLVGEPMNPAGDGWAVAHQMADNAKQTIQAMLASAQATGGGAGPEP
ncbi:MAG: lysophospholipid acyltransferase family protein [Acidimicrobiales bacterium]